MSHNAYIYIWYLIHNVGWYLSARSISKVFSVNIYYVNYATTRCFNFKCKFFLEYFTTIKMASGLRTIIEQELECAFCLERLKDPRAFPECHHLFCYQCIAKLSEGIEKISCPECREEVEVS